MSKINLHSDAISRSRNPIQSGRDSTLTLEQRMINNIISAVYPVPPVFDENHYMKLKEAADFLGVADDYEELDPACAPDVFDEKLKRRTVDLVYRVRKTLNWLDKFKSKLKLPDELKLKSKLDVNTELLANDLMTFIKINANDTYESDVTQNFNDKRIANYYKNQASPELAGILTKDIKVLVSQFNKVITNIYNSPQIKAALSQAVYSDISFDSIANYSDETLLLSYSQNEEYIRNRKLADNIALNDFKERKPEILFVSDYVTNKFQGELIGWKKVQGAAGYILKRIDVFNKDEVNFTLYNEDLLSQSGAVDIYVKSFLASFYDLNIKNLLYFWDDTVERHKFYIYKLIAFQNYYPSKTNVFIVPIIAASPTNEQKRNIRNLIENVDPGAGRDNISPYPFLAKVLLGDSHFDWMLAGVNIRNSLLQRENRSITRGYAYLNAQLNFIYQQIDNGKFVLPREIQVIIANITHSLNTIGIIETLRDILKETGVLFFFDGIDPEFTYGSNVESKFLKIISSAIDGSNFTLNTNTFLINYNKFIGNGISNSENVGSGGITQSIRSGVQEISTPFNTISLPGRPTLPGKPKIPEISRPIDALLSINKNSGGLLISDIGDIEKNIDLTTIKGISKLMQLIRTINDLGPTRSNVSLENE